MDFLRTPDDRFENLPDYEFSPNYVQLSNGGRMHYIDTGGDGELVVMLHGEPSWGFLYRHVIHGLQDAYRCIAPDLLGFGRSDKPTKDEDHTFSFHYESLIEFIETLDLKDITLVVQDWGGLLGLPLATHHETRIKRLVIMNTALGTGDIELGEGFTMWQNFAKQLGREMIAGTIVQTGTVTGLNDAIVAAYNAPFPDATYRAGIAMMPLRVPSTRDLDGAELSRKARQLFKTWDRPTLIMFGDSDPVTGPAARFFENIIPSESRYASITIEGGGHFLQEDKGAELAEHIRAFMEHTP